MAEASPLEAIQESILDVRATVATDSTCVRLMGLDPGRIVHVREGAKFIGIAAA